MNINFELLDLRAFLTVYEFRNFHKAAELLHLSQPALSRRVRNLENRLQVPLLERSTRRVTPTAAGRKFEPMARRLLDELEVSLVSIGGPGDQQGGQITIASLPSAATYFLPRLIKNFSKQYPLVRLRVLDRLISDANECVLHGEAEFGINVSDPAETDLNFFHLVDDPYVFVCRRDHPLARKKRITWQNLCGPPIVGIGRAADVGNRNEFDDLVAKTKLRFNWICEVYNFTIALQLIEAGVGGSVLPQMAVPQIRGSGITIRTIGPVRLTRSIGIVERRNGRLSPPAQYLRDMLIADCGMSPQ
jgi:DNA-binding transcriptional LysR family regulator